MEPDGTGQVKDKFEIGPAMAEPNDIAANNARVSGNPHLDLHKIPLAQTRKKKLINTVGKQIKREAWANMAILFLEFKNFPKKLATQMSVAWLYSNLNQHNSLMLISISTNRTNN